MNDVMVAETAEPVVVPWHLNPHSLRRGPAALADQMVRQTDPTMVAPKNARQIETLNSERRIPKDTQDEIQRAIERTDEPGFDDETPTQEQAWQASPVWTSHGRPCSQLMGVFKGAAAFLVCGGPSLTTEQTAKLDRRGLLIAAVNNVAATLVRPHLWFACDDVRSFHEAIWADPAIMKFQKMKYLKRRFKWAGGDTETKTCIRRWDGSTFASTHDEAGDFANVYGYFHRKGWDASRFFSDPTPTWGQPKSKEHPEQEYFLSIMLPAIWLLRWLGVAKLYLVGCDFKMPRDGEAAYAFPEKGNASGNNGLYRILNKRFAELRPHAEAAGIDIANATGDGTDSGGGALTAFRRVRLDDAISEALTVFRFPSTIETLNHYLRV